MKSWKIIRCVGLVLLAAMLLISIAMLDTKSQHLRQQFQQTTNRNLNPNNVPEQEDYVKKVRNKYNIAVEYLTFDKILSE